MLFKLLFTLVCKDEHNQTTHCSLLCLLEQLGWLVGWLVSLGLNRAVWNCRRFIVSVYCMSVISPSLLTYRWHCTCNFIHIQHIPAKCHAWGVIVMPTDQKLGSHAYSCLCSDLSCLIEKFEPLQHYWHILKNLLIIKQTRTKESFFF